MSATNDSDRPMRPAAEGFASATALPKPDLAIDLSDSRAHAAWRTWLSALATDAEVAMAAALTYESLEGGAREQWLDVLEQESATLLVPKIALYAPLLAVEMDDIRRARIYRSMRPDRIHSPSLDSTWAFRGVGADGIHAATIVCPAYLDFVQVLQCTYWPDQGFQSVRHDPLRHRKDAPAGDIHVDDVPLEPTPTRFVVEELAHAIVADLRQGKEAPPALTAFVHLFEVEVSPESEAP
jgi:hypothetical protein